MEMVGRIMLLLGCLCITQFIHAQGTVFVEGGLEKALEEAELTHKLVLVDCYTSWCAPCRRLAKEIFPAAEAGNYFNEKFVCCKVDMETEEGFRIEDSYGVFCYPTLLLLHPGGEEINRVVGGSALPEVLISRVETALLPENSWRVMRERYRQDTSFEADYFNMLEQKCLQREFASVLSERFLSQTNVERFAPQNWMLYKYNVLDVTSPVLDYITKNENIVSSFLTKNEIKAFIEECVLVSLQAMLTNYRDNQQGITKLEQLFVQYEYLSWPFLKVSFDLVKAKNAKDYDCFIDIFQQRVILLHSLRRKELEKGLIRLTCYFSDQQREKVKAYFKRAGMQESSGRK